MAHKKHIKKRRRSPIRFLFLLILLIAVLIGIVVFMLHSKLGKVQTKALDQSQLVTVNNDNNMKDYTNYAFFGIDSQTGSMSDRGNRSDSIIVVSINNSTKEVKLLSIYRDTFLSINGKYSKINAAYSWGGPELAISTINRNLDLNIEKYATVNFKILANIVDAVGGIEVNVDKSIIKNLNSYIKDMNRINGGNSSTIKSAGTYTLDGNQAVAYSRIRYTAGGDFERTSRQRLVIEKLVEKAKSADLGTINKVIDAVFPEISTSFSSTEIIGLAADVFNYELGENSGFPFTPETPESIPGYSGSYVVAAGLADNVRQAHEFLFGDEDYEPTEVVQGISDELSEMTGIYPQADEEQTEDTQNETGSE